MAGSHAFSAHDAIVWYGCEFKLIRCNVNVCFCKLQWLILKWTIELSLKCLPLIHLSLTKDVTRRPKYRELLKHPLILRYEEKQVDVGRWLSGVLAQAPLQNLDKLEIWCLYTILFLHKWNYVNTWKRIWHCLCWVYIVQFSDVCYTHVCLSNNFFLDKFWTLFWNLPLS